MARDTKKQELVVTGEQTAEILTGMNPVDLETLGQSLKDMKEGANLTSEYLEIEVGESKRLIVVGIAEITDMNDKEKKNPAIKFLDEDGNFLISASAVLVNNLKVYAEKGILKPIQIECTGKKGQKPNEYYVFKIVELTH